MVGRPLRSLLVFSPECHGYDCIAYRGGIGRAVYNVTNRIGDGYRIFVFTRTDKDEPVVHRPSESLTVVGLKPPPPIGWIQDWNWNPYDRNCKEASDHWTRMDAYIAGSNGELSIHLHDAVAWYNDWSSVLPMMGFSKKGVNGLLTFHMSHRMENADGDPRLRMEKDGAEHILSGNCMGSVASNAQKGIIQEAYKLPDEKLAVIPNGVDTGVFSPAARGNTGVLDRYGIGRDPYVLFCGGPVKRKGSETVLRALPYVEKGRPGLNVVFMSLGTPELNGNHEFWKTLESKELKGYRQKVKFPTTATGRGGFIPDGDRAAIYANAEVGILPSNPGLTSLECQACGVPVVVEAGTETIVDGTTGIAADPADPQRIAEAALACMGSPGMGPAARQLMEDRFTWDRQASLYRQLFDSL